MPSLIDTHSHIYVGKFAADIDQVMERARNAGVETIIVPATKPSEFRDALALAERFPEVRTAIGVHPHHAHEVDDADLREVERLAESGNVIAVGEIGIDYYYEFSPRERQHEVFRHQLRIARRLGLPAVVHNRDSDEDVLRIIEEEQDGALRFQLHCFSSNEDVLRRALDLGGMISFTGNITYSKGALDGVVRAVPDDRIMVETDAPYLTPVPHRGKRNEPEYVSLVADKVAELRGETIDAIREMTTTNARRFFQLALLLIAILGLSVADASAQPAPRPVRTVDTTSDPPFEKIFGIGAQLTSVTYISGAVTEANAAGLGVWLTAAPLQPLGVDWLQVDVIFNSTEVPQSILDSAYQAAARGARNGDTARTPPANLHSTIDFSLRATANPRKIITFFASFGVTYFSNEFGIDRYLVEHGDTTLKDYRESAWGIGGSLGISYNFNTPYGTISPTAEWRVATISGERKLPKRQNEFFLSQPRIGIILYPNFNKFFE